MMCELFRTELETFRTEAEAAAQFLYASLAVNALASTHDGILKRLNTAPLFWNTIQGSLQKSAFIALGRIFDNNSPHNVARLLSRAQEVGIFSKDELARRKQGEAQTRPEWLDDYLSGAYETTSQDIRRLRKEVNKWRKVYEEKYKPLRDRYYAHRDLKSEQDELQTLISSTRVDELERMCIFLISLHDALWEAYENGREPIVAQKTHSVLEMLQPDHRIRSAPEIVAHQARKFFENDI